MSLATKYRPKTFDEVVGQTEIKTILLNQLNSGDIYSVYLFTGGAGTGKTTCARLFADRVNNDKGNPIEIDGASNNGVDQVRIIIEQAKTKSIDSEYKVFIIDECHMVTIQGWNALLKTIEEPPAKTIFIFCTTNPEKIPLTILSRVQRYDFKRIKQSDIEARLTEICKLEEVATVNKEAIEYIAKLADGGMRDAITMMDKCLSLNTELTVNNVTDALGLPYYEDLANILYAISTYDDGLICETIENVNNSGVDLVQFIEEEIKFIVDLSKWRIFGNMRYCSCPNFIEDWFKKGVFTLNSDCLNHILETMLNILATVKYDSNAKTTIEAMLLLENDYIKFRK